MFQETIKAVTECDFDFIFNSRYSVRKGTIAAKIFPDDIPEEIKAERWHILNNLLKKNVLKRNKLMI
jgi:tRNA-2-methylthio-N6-dimethylallyladenosine synthase